MGYLRPLLRSSKAVVRNPQASLTFNHILLKRAQIFMLEVENEIVTESSLCKMTREVSLGASSRVGQAGMKTEFNFKNL